MINYNWLVVEPTPLKNMSSSVGMIIAFPTEWKVIKFHGSKPPTRSSFTWAFSNYNWLRKLHLSYPKDMYIYTYIYIDNITLVAGVIMPFTRVKGHRINQNKGKRVSCILLYSVQPIHFSWCLIFVTWWFKYV